MKDLRRHLSIALLAAALAAGAPTALGSESASPPGTPPAPHLPDAFEDLDDVPVPDPDLWHRIRMGFGMEPLDSPLVQEHEQWYASRPDYIERFVDRGSLYLHYIVEQVEKRRMPMEVALLPVIESAFTPKALSRAKASGIWQFIPSTGKNYGLKQDWWRDNRNDVIAATDAALSYLERLHQMFGSWELALAAYNCGEGCVGRAIAANQRRGLPTDFLSLKLPPETRNYVPKLIAVKNIVLSPATYGIEIDSIPDSPYFTTVEAPARIDLKLVARLAEMDEAEFLALNPAHNKPVAVSVAGMNRLVLPIDKVETFRANLEAYDKPLVSWTTYNARRGEALDAIARRHGLTLAELKAANDALRVDRKNRLRLAAPVMVPLRAAAAKAPPPLAQARASAPPSAKRQLSPVQAAAEGARTYVVRAGDTLYGIAQRFGTGVEALLSLNQLTAKAVIQPGLKLRLP